MGAVFSNPDVYSFSVYPERIEKTETREFTDKFHIFWSQHFISFMYGL